MSRVWVHLLTPPLQPEDFDLTTWQRDYTGALPWDGETSQGVSDTFREAVLTSVPAAGFPLNGHNAALYNNQGRNSRTTKIAGGAAVVGDDVVTNAAFTFSILADVSGGGKLPTQPYFAAAFYQGDAHWGVGFYSEASMGSQNPTITFDAGAQTITRSAGNWITDGFTTGRSVYISETASNNGVKGVPEIVTATVLTFAEGIVTEAGSVLPRIIAGQSKIRCFVFTGAWSFVEANVDPGLRWIYVRHTTGFTQIDIDGAAGSNQAHTDHAGANVIAMKSNTDYTEPLTFRQYERFTSKTAHSDAYKNAYRLYLNERYGLSF